jgi:hypothetical protein
MIIEEDAHKIWARAVIIAILLLMGGIGLSSAFSCIETYFRQKTENNESVMEYHKWLLQNGLIDEVSIIEKMTF